MPRFSVYSISVALLFVQVAADNADVVAAIQVGLQPSVASHNSISSSAAQGCPFCPFDWMKRLFGSSHHETEVHGPMSKIAKLEIYYETLCPYCTMLFNESVREIISDKEFMERLDLHLYPFGNALMMAKENISEGFQFWHDEAVYPVFRCQHGDQECLGNMIQACVIDQVKNVELSTNFTICMASFGTEFGIEKTSYECGVHLGIDMHAVKECANSHTGADLLSAMGAESDREGLNRTHVPYVVVNGVHEDAADSGFLLKPLCAVMEDPKPALCNATLGKAHKDLGCGGEGHGC